MPLVTSTEMFKKAYEGHYAVGAFNVNNMEIIQGIVAAAQQEKSPLILQVSAGARKYASHVYLMKLVEAAIEETGLPICLLFSNRYRHQPRCLQIQRQTGTGLCSSGKNHQYAAELSSGSPWCFYRYPCFR